jgi:hypothetical protein
MPWKIIPLEEEAEFLERPCQTTRREAYEEMQRRRAPLLIEGGQGRSAAEVRRLGEAVVLVALGLLGIALAVAALIGIVAPA